MPDETIHRAIIGLQSRSQALAVYGVTAIFVGLSMTFGGAPGTIEEHFGSISRLLLGAPLAVGGALVLASSVRVGQTALSHYGALAGMLVFSLWALAITIAYTAGGLQDGFMLAWPNQDIPRTAAKAYVPFLYQGIMCLALLHVSTFLRLGPPRRPVDSTP